MGTPWGHPLGPLWGHVEAPLWPRWGPAVSPQQPQPHALQEERMRLSHCVAPALPRLLAKVGAGGGGRRRGGRSGGTAGTIGWRWGHSEVTLRGQSGVALGTLRVALGTLRGDTLGALGWQWGHMEVTLRGHAGWLWGHSEVTLRGRGWHTGGTEVSLWGRWCRYGAVGVPLGPLLSLWGH